jgi:WD40 repeat protein/tRNA A-37 threonylcarbamoyl transferase component Bud32
MTLKDREQTAPHSLDEVLAWYMNEVDSGRAPSREELLARFGHLKSELTEFFADEAHVDRWAAPLRALAASTAHEAPTLAEDGLTSCPPMPRALGGYALLEELGQGGMGVVYKAQQKNPSRLVALKVIRAGQFASEADRLRFRNEADVIAHLDHPHIVPIYEVGEAEGVHYFSMKLMEGGTLGRQGSGARGQESGVRKERQQRAAEVLVKVARAVHHAHQHGILHRDLKPGNILLDSRSEPHVSDFGLAKPVESDDAATASQTIAGTAPYMAPEQANAEKRLTTAADIYGLGATLYELLTGRPPFQGSTPLDTLIQVREQEPVRPRVVDPRIDADLETICLKCLEKNPAKRYASAEELARDLERWLAGEPIQARRSGRVERLAKWCRRRPAAASLIGVIAASIVGFLALAGFLWQNAELRAEAVQDLQVAETKKKDAEAKRQKAEERKQEAEKRVRALEQIAKDINIKVEALRQRAEQEQARATKAGERADGVLYAADMQFAHAAWESEEIPRMVQLLEAHRPVAGQSDRRGFEWHYLWRLGHGERFTLAAGKPPAETEDAEAAVLLTVSPDGKTLAAAGPDKKVRLWELATGRAIRSFNGPGRVVALAFTPDGRGLRLVSAKEQGKEAALQAYMQFVFQAFKAKAEPTLKHFTDALTEQEYSLEGKPRAKAAKFDLRRPAGAIQLSSDVLGEGLLLGDGLVPLKDQNLLIPFAAAPAADGKALAVAGMVLALPGVGKGPKRSELEMAGAVLVWDVVADRQRAVFKPGVLVLSAAFSPDGRTLALGGFDGAVRLWDVETGKERASWAGHRTLVTSVSFSADGARLVSASADGVVKLWDVAGGKVVRSFRGHRAAVTSALLTADGATLVSAAADGPVKVWDTAVAAGPVTAKFAQVVVALSFTPDGRSLSALDQDGSFFRCDPRTGKHQVLSRLPKVIKLFDNIAIGPDGKTVAVFGDKGGVKPVVKVYDGTTGKETLTLEESGDFPMAVAFSVDGKTLAAAAGPPGKGHLIRLWDLTTGKKKIDCAGHPEFTHSLAFSPDGKRLASGSQDGTVRIWEVAGGNEVLRITDFDQAVVQIAYSLDGKTLAVASGDSVTLRDAESGKIVKSLPGYSHEATYLAFHPRGRRLVTTGGIGGTGRGSGVKLWDLGTGREVLNLGATRFEVSNLVFSPDGNRLAATLVEVAFVNPFGGRTPCEVMIWDATPMRD